MKLIKATLTLLGTNPPIWRELLLSPDMSLGRLHSVIQAAMGWQDYHLHSFAARGNKYSDPNFELGDGSSDERRVLVRDVFTTCGDRLSYDYDFGDYWRHTLIFEAFVESDVQTSYAICTSGARACPPEDCGGIPGYEDLLRARTRRRFNPDAFSLEETNERLSRVFRRRGSMSRPNRHRVQ